MRHMWNMDIALLMIPIEELKLYSGAYPEKAGLSLLMIPIEELKQSIVCRPSENVCAFDDTY